MLLIRLAISLFALALIATALSFNAAESSQNDHASLPTTVINR